MSILKKNNTKISGWGRYPTIDAKSITYQNVSDLRGKIKKIEDCIARGNGRSYGDSSLSNNYISCLPNNRFLDFNNKTGLLECESGVLLSEILDVFVSQGWFIKVVPGTKLITVGGAIASDIHGKNHHREGCFGDTVHDIKLMLGDGKIIKCSPVENKELFFATCGGMGLTGIILEASFYLKRITSCYIEQTTTKTRSLQETFDSFEKNADKDYSVAWIDSLAKGDLIGRSLLMTGNFSKDGNLYYQPKKIKKIPINFASIGLNYLTIKVFNALYYAKAKAGVSDQIVDLDSFFFPLDSIDSWNRIYGRNGFVQYQFILPKDVSYEGLHSVLKKISNKGFGSFLAVIKLHGKQNDHYLSFPMEGYSLALDFKIQAGLLDLLRELDQIVLDFNGRIYLSKDARVNREVFESGYPKIEDFRKLRQDMGLTDKFSSLQSERLSL